MNPGKDTLALASTEIDLSPLKEGQSLTVIWRGKPGVMHHPNIVLFRETYLSKKGLKVIVMEFAEGQDLEQIMHNRKVASECLKKPLENF